MRCFLIRLLCVVLLVLMSSCKEEIHTLSEFNQYINNPENGYKQIKSVNGVMITVLYTPPEYLALKKMEERKVKSREIYDSLLTENKLSLSFIMAFGPDESKGNSTDIMYDGIANFKEYTERALTLNFDMENNVELHTSKGTFSPALSSLENTYGLSKDRKVNLVFTPSSTKNELADADDMDFVYSDETFDVGILHFSFDKKHLHQQLPEITIR